MSHELPDVQGGFRKCKGTRDQIADIHWIIEKARELNKQTNNFCFIDYAKAFDCVDHNKLWKILKEMGIPDHLTCLLRNLYAGQEATVRTKNETMDCFKVEKEVRLGFVLSPCLFNLYTVCCAVLSRSVVFNSCNSMESTSCEMLGWMNHRLESRLPGEISTSNMQMIPL